MSDLVECVISNTKIIRRRFQKVNSSNKIKKVTKKIIKQPP